jgi:hypothetical protein
VLQGDGKSHYFKDKKPVTSAKINFRQLFGNKFGSILAKVG